MENQIRAVLQRQDLTASMKLIMTLVHLEGGSYLISNQELGKATATNKSTVVRCLARLKKEGLLKSRRVNRGREKGVERTLVAINLPQNFISAN